ncbi:Bug family tripartite tricarboxylate transporter substrate binding protein [Variovorax arabinosiphilus]|uniref:Bug family tripartite tricarboxylate transporter substrate binding protein n=1 Tax=Variovorax arabinosiphilus TaxID=3053498 RepID=UPI0025781477|nr:MULTISPECIES: tripartite tricarboxylate transporter substrate binding protein [unclassified Variovorax]MDM0122711.1 tripartite tricarboxylate transporter substrate binding protein [Variovorax sp. J2L1-78]MDM0132293.1 tripartite tricarboxylate transporter substrate binding protein [Variovorax sp. J2L1-63]MDM0235474.1 tripartite tricarboxylate transporter substrate binding protein [Variovorax sp. J2R1-6]
MHHFRPLFSCVTLALCGLAWSAGAALADVYPSKPITLVVGYPPGGSTDLTGRALGLELSQRLGVPVVIENVGGAGGAIGAQKVANAAPDGYTLLVGANNEVAISRLVNPSVRYDLKDFTPIGLVASQPLVLVASPTAGVKNANDLLALLKKNPGKFSYGSSGVGTSLHLAGEMVKQQGGVFMTHVPYRGVAPLTNDLLGGNIEFGMFVLSSALPYIRNGKMVALGTTEAKRSAITPDLPALGESPALKGLDIGVWFALLGPARLPEPVQVSLKKALADILQSPDFRKKMEASSSVVPAVPVDLDRFLVSETAKYQKIVQFANIKE